VCGINIPRLSYITVMVYIARANREAIQQVPRHEPARSDAILTTGTATRFSRKKRLSVSGQKRKSCQPLPLKLRKKSPKRKRRGKSGTANISASTSANGNGKNAPKGRRSPRRFSEKSRTANGRFT